MLRNFIKFAIVIGTSLCLISPIEVKSDLLSSENIVPLGDYPSLKKLLPSVTTSDLDGDGKIENISLENGIAKISRGTTIQWMSPPDWEVRQAEIADLNQDAQPELVLLVYRPYQPWPVDRYLSGVSRTGEFHDDHFRSCQLIQIGWKKDRFAEVWAGSALAEPLQRFAVYDLNQDGKQELIAFETTYQDDATHLIHAVSVWDWNGFGFTLEFRQKLKADVWAAGMNDSNHIVLQFNRFK